MRKCRSGIVSFFKNSFNSKAIENHFPKPQSDNDFNQIIFWRKSLSHSIENDLNNENT